MRFTHHIDNIFHGSSLPHPRVEIKFFNNILQAGSAHDLLADCIHNIPGPRSDIVGRHGGWVDTLPLVLKDCGRFIDLGGSQILAQPQGNPE
ncbi:MAG: hypothetical protein M0Q52_11950 [Lascolabacillus sp.]|nr:hypothetical protein [Lascolabacillus sp.]